MQKIGKFDAKIIVLPLGFTINNNLIFIDGMEFMNFSPNALVRNL